MKPIERPLIFGPQQVRSLLRDQKTQTRRKVRIQPHWDHQSGLFVWAFRKIDFCWSTSQDLAALQEHLLPACPYGQVGDRLWVREAWQVRDGQSYYTRADVKAHRTQNPNCHEIWERTQPPEAHPRWRSPRFMPRWASRLLLEITGIRFERLQDLTDADALAEGVQEMAHYVGSEYGGDAYQGRTGWFTDGGCHRGGFGKLWDSIHGPGSWLKNEFVWVIEFKVVNHV